MHFVPDLLNKVEAVFIMQKWAGTSHWKSRVVKTLWMLSEKFFWKFRSENGGDSAVNLFSLCGSLAVQVDTSVLLEMTEEKVA